MAAHQLFILVTPGREQGLRRGRGSAIGVEMRVVAGAGAGAGAGVGTMAVVG